MTVQPDVRIARGWDACVIADYLAGKPNAMAHARPIVESAKRGASQIWVSQFAHVEVAYLDGYSDTQSEEIITEFFGQDYVVPITLDPFVSETARALIRRFHIKGKDAVHVASAIRWRVPIFETFDRELVKKLVVAAADPKLGHLEVREPLYTGQRRLDEQLDESVS